MGLRELALEHLRTEGSDYGLGILEALKAKGHLIWFGCRIYGILRDLERDGYLESFPLYAEPVLRNCIPRKYYVLTKKGRQL